MPKTILTKGDRWPGIEVVSPTFSVVTETFAFEGLGGFYRTKSVAGNVWNVAGRNRKELISLPDIRPDHTLELQNPFFSVAGHLIAASLTGTDDPENLTPVSKYTNDLQQVVENKIKKLGVTHLTVTVEEYYAEDPRVPKTFRYFCRSLTGATLLDERVVQPWVNTGPVGTAAELIETIEAANLAVKFLGWKIEDVNSSAVGHRDLSFLAGHLPKPEHRPYAGLDWLMMTRLHNSLCDESTTLAYVNSIGNSADFAGITKRLALRANPVLHGDFLVSDAYSKPHTYLEATHGAVIETESALMNGGGANAPQVDHIFPKAAGGANCLSNAQITSMRYNSSKQDTIKVLEIRSPAWKRDMLEKMKTDPHLKFF
jgi:hypothetical protein